MINRGGSHIDFLPGDAIPPIGSRLGNSPSSQLAVTMALRCSIFTLGRVGRRDFGWCVTRMRFLLGPISLRVRGGWPISNEMIYAMRTMLLIAPIGICESVRDFVFSLLFFL